MRTLPTLVIYSWAVVPNKCLLSFTSSVPRLSQATCFPNNDDSPRQTGVVLAVKQQPANEDLKVLREVEATIIPSVADPAAIALKEELVTLANESKRGFSASRSQRQRAKEIMMALSTRSPTKEPAAAYYRYNSSFDVISSENSLAGKWTLLYTDAPDITSLDNASSSLAKLGRIGQECTPPHIDNVIEWQRPDWAASLFGSTPTRLLQKVCCRGRASPDRPTMVELTILGLDLVVGDTGRDYQTNQQPNSTNDDHTSLSQTNDISDKSTATMMQGDGGSTTSSVASWLEDNTVKLRGPTVLPFGRFEILYLDEDMRIVRTDQNYYAVNLREFHTEWF